MSLSETQNGAFQKLCEDTVGSGKVKKSLKQSVNVDLSEARNGEVAEEGVENVQVKKKKKKKSTVIVNGEAATQPPNSEPKKKKKKKRKMVADAGPGEYFSFSEIQALTQFARSPFHLRSVIFVFLQHARILILRSLPEADLVATGHRVRGVAFLFLLRYGEVVCFYVP